MADRRQPSIQALFHSLDNEEVFRLAETTAAAAVTQNFVVEFSQDYADIAFDLDEAAFRVLLDQDVPSGSVRWINVWTPSSQPCAIKTICGHYGFSMRLQTLMAFESARPPRPAPHMGQRGRGNQESSLRDGIAEDDETFDMYELVKGTMNYSSIDQGDRFLCIGANWLHQRVALDCRQDRTPLVPPKHWSWLALCDDCTVLSFHGAPTFEQEGMGGVDNRKRQREELRFMRSNTLSVLLQLSRHGHERNILRLKSVRPIAPQGQTGAHATPRRTSTLADPEKYQSWDASSNLFYYLFEDYTAAVRILNSTRKLLDDMSKLVLNGTFRYQESNQIVPGLHNLSKDLRQLQHLFESYKSLISRIVGTRGSDLNASVAMHPDASDLSLAPAARNRFERLGDRLQLLMLNVIKDYLEESSALSHTYFNLTAQKDSEATARLTRATTLLAKLSVFFIPITFVTSYFSVEIPHMLEDYTSKTYWVTIGAIAAISFVALLFFSRLLVFFSETLDAWTLTSSQWLRQLLPATGQKGLPSR